MSGRAVYLFESGIPQKRNPALGSPPATTTVWRLGSGGQRPQAEAAVVLVRRRDDGEDVARRTVTEPDRRRVGDRGAEECRERTEPAW